MTVITIEVIVPILLFLFATWLLSEVIVLPVLRWMGFLPSGKRTSLHDELVKLEEEERVKAVQKEVETKQKEVKGEQHE